MDLWISMRSMDSMDFFWSMVHGQSQKSPWNQKDRSQWMKDQKKKQINFQKKKRSLRKIKRSSGKQDLPSPLFESFSAVIIAK